MNLQFIQTGLTFPPNNDTDARNGRCCFENLGEEWKRTEPFKQEKIKYLCELRFLKVRFLWQ